MQFAFTDEQAMIAETARQFFADNVSSERCRKAMEADGLDRESWHEFCQQMGLGGLLIGEEFGGSALGLVEFASVAEAAGAQVAAIPLFGLGYAASAISAGGSEVQKKEWLEKLASGNVIAAAGGKEQISAKGDKLSGDIEFLPHGAAADIFILSSGHQAWIVKAGDGGVCVTAQTSMDQTRPMARLSLDNAAGDPLPNAKAALAAGRAAGWICLSAEALGGAQACLTRTCDYARERIQFGRPIGSFQAYKHRLADMMVEIEQARSAVYWAACAVEENSDDPQLALHAAKSFCADSFFKCASDMIQLHGGIGFTWEHDAHLYFKRARSIQTMMHDGHWHREQIATMLLGEAA